jgi:predicted acylesterase/phospholipase RssA
MAQAGDLLWELCLLELAPSPSEVSAWAPRTICEMVAFVLSGGASFGAIQAGMLYALYEREIAPELIVGTSAGAVNGAFIASRPPTVATAQSQEAELNRPATTVPAGCASFGIQPRRRADRASLRAGEHGPRSP